MEENRVKPASAGIGLDSYGPDALPANPIAVRLSAARMWRNKLFLLGSICVGSLVGLMWGAVHTPLYRVQASIEVHAPVHQPSPNSGQEVSSEAASPYMQTELRIARSRTVTERAMSKLSDRERARLLEPRYFWQGKSTYDQNLEDIRRRLQAQSSEQANIIDIAFLSPDATAGAHFLNALAQELSDYMVESSWRLAQHRRDWSDRQMDDLRRRWEESERLLAEYSQTTRAAPSRTSIPINVASGANDPSIARLKRREIELNQELNQWTSLYGPSSASAVRLRSEAAAVSAAIRARRMVLARTLKSATTTSISAAPVSTRDFTKPETIAHLTVLKQDAESSRRIYQSTQAAFQEARIAPASQMGDINVVDPATPQDAPVTPNQLLNGTLGGFIGLVIGVSFITLQDRYSRTFANPRLLHEYLGVEVLGCLPAESSAATPLPIPTTTDEPALNLAYGHDAQTAEAYRSIRAAIFFRVEGTSGPWRFVITSAAETEGRTTVTGNLGAALASAQRRVLLVDGDLRNPGLHKAFGAANEYGLADLLSRQLTAESVSIRDVVRATQVPGLYLLSAGQAGVLAPEILSAVQLPQLLRELGKGFDFVLIDSPPVLPYSDTRILAKAADAAVLVVQAAVTSRQSALLATDVISRDGIRILGSILTNWERTLTAGA